MFVFVYDASIRETKAGQRSNRNISQKYELILNSRKFHSKIPGTIYYTDLIHKWLHS